MDILTELLEWCKHIIDIVAVIIMLWGVILSVIKLVKVETSNSNDIENIVYKENIRAFLATYILLGLELFIVADIIQIIVSPDYNDLIILVVVVVVRTVISFFLERDFKEALNSIKMLNDGEFEDFYLPKASFKGVLTKDKKGDLIEHPVIKENKQSSNQKINDEK